jgi:F0F1-type ATP synthase assembly protein I
MEKPDPYLVRKLLKYTSIPFEFFILIGGGAWLGSALDKKFCLKHHVLTVIFAIFGLLIGFYHVYKSLKNDKLQ